jgi:small subunit ribosomal protein S8
VVVPHSKLKESIANVLKDERYLDSVTVKDHEITLELAANGSTVKLVDLKRSSKPGRRLYLAAGELPRVREGLGIAVVSTSRGVMTADQARKQKLGGELLAEVY